MSDKRKRRAAAIFLMAAGAALFLVPAVLPGRDGQETYTASGRKTEIPDAVLPEGTISVNSADTDELILLDGIGETLSVMIIDERMRNGSFHYPEDLTAVKGIGVRKMNGIRESINLDDSLNPEP